MKKTWLLFASLLVLASLSVPTIVLADDVPPVCGPDGCTKPGVQLVVGLNR